MSSAVHMARLRSCTCSARCLNLPQSTVLGRRKPGGHGCSVLGAIAMSLLQVWRKAVKYCLVLQRQRQLASSGELSSIEFLVVLVKAYVLEAVRGRPAALMRSCSCCQTSLQTAST